MSANLNMADFGIDTSNPAIAAAMQSSALANLNHSATNLIVNYIPTTLSDDDFIKLFSSIGPIRSCKIVRDKSTHQSFGFGFCDYVSFLRIVRCVVNSVCLAIFIAVL